MRVFRIVVAIAIALAGACSASTEDGDSVSSDTESTTSSPSASPTTSNLSTTAPSTVTPPTTGEDPYLEDRLTMVETQIESRGVSDPAVLEAMRTVPRHEFVPADLVDRAYRNHPLPIGHGQTISQPIVVATMSELLELGFGEKVLEIGTGSGYQAAVLAAMGADVYTIEIIPELAGEAATRLANLGYDVSPLTADGYFGWEEHAPFDAIIVTAAPDHVPQPLVNQLAEGGRMVIPVGPIGAVQTMWRFSVDQTGELLGENFGPVYFVPFTRDEPAA